MFSRVAADAVVVFHLAFLVFIATGSLLALRWPKVLWLHVPSVVWGLISVTIGIDCPLTPLEKSLRRAAGDEGYAGGFVDHYIEGVVYPERFTGALQAMVALAVIAGYGLLLRRRATRPRVVVAVGRSDGTSSR